MQVPQEIIDRLSQNKLVAFIGAGLSIGAGLPNWPNLMRQMIEWCKKRHIDLPREDELNELISDKEFLSLADTLIEQMGDTRFRQFMTETFRNSRTRHTDTHSLLTQIPFSAVLTSNFDTLIENAYAEADSGQIPHAFTYLETGELSEALSTDEFHILKTHGTIDRNDSIVLSGRQYRDLVNGNNAYKIYLQQTLISKTILFLGFSLTDPDLLAVLGALRHYFNNDTSPHYALIDASTTSSVKIRRFEADYGIRVIPYTPSDETHPEVPLFLRQIIKHGPNRYTRNLFKAAESLRDIDEHYHVVGKAESASEIVLEIHEKYPGAAEEHPLSFSYNLAFDTNTPDGKKAADDVQNFFDKGEGRVTIDSRFIQDIELPELLKKFINTYDNPQITIGPAKYDAPPKLFRLVIESKEERATIEGIELKKTSGGAKQAVLSNEHQNLPIRVKLIVNLELDEFDRWAGQLTFNIDYDRLNLFQEIQVEKFLTLFARGGRYFFEDPITGQKSGQSEISPNTIEYTPKPARLRMLEDLYLIEQTLGVTLKLPDKFRIEDVKKIADLAIGIRTGRCMGDVSFNVQANPENVLDWLNSNKTARLTNYAELIEFVWGERLSLGLAWITCEEMTIPDDESVRLRKALSENPARTSYLVKFATSPDNPALFRFVDYLPSDEFEALHEDPEFRQTALNSLTGLLFEAASIGDGNLDVNCLEVNFRAALSQTTPDGKPYNMLRRCTTEELTLALNPHLNLLNDSQKNTLIERMLSWGLLKDEE